MRSFLSSVITALVIMTFIIGCSGSGTNPLSPNLDGSGTPGTTPDTSYNIPIPDPNQTSRTPELTDPNSHPLQGMKLQVNHALWGLYEITLEPGSDTLEIVPLRGANLHLNALKFLEPGGKYNMVQLASGLSWSESNTKLDLDIRIVHPFAGLPQFSGFDVKGIVITDGTKTGFSDSKLVMSAKSDLHLLNSDGYTRWWNPREFPGNTIFAYTDGALGMKDSKFNFKSTVNGFKYFADALTPNADVETMNLADRGIFRSGGNNIRHYTLRLPSGFASLKFNYAIDASWEPPDVKPPVNLPGDFPLKANQPEPYRIITQESLNTLYFEGPMSNGGQLQLDIFVYDWQSPLPVTALGTVEKVVAEWPGVFPPTEATFFEDMGEMAHYKVTLTPAPGALTSTNDLEYIVWAESQDGDGYGGSLDPSVPLIAINRFSTKVSNVKPNTPPQITNGVIGNASPGLYSENYSVTAFDPDPDTLTYLWSVQPEGNPYDFQLPGDGAGNLSVNWATYGFGSFVVQCQVSDGVNPPVNAIELPVMVGNTPPQLGDIEGLIDVAAGDTNVIYTVPVTDPDTGQTFTFMWSFVKSGQPESFSIPGDPGDGSLTIDYSSVDPDLYDINVQVSDGYTPVTGTAILVTHNNTLPTVGDVIGPEIVGNLDTNAHYQATASDPDTTQTLSYLWSVVPENNPANFIIPANGDGSVNIDWSDYPEGAWDVNVRVNDGIGSTVGGKLTVERLPDNHPPTIENISGPLTVTHSDIEDYDVTIDDPDGDPLTVLWSLVPAGNPEDFNIPGADGTPLTVDWAVYPNLGDYDINVRASDGINPPVTGTKITVSLINTPPNIDGCNGPTNVTSANTNTKYNVTATDIDTTQTLTSVWSVVPTGNAPNFVLNGAGDLSLTFNWATVPVGIYDVAVRVSDGIAFDECGPIVVTKANTPPVVGVVSGPSPVFCNEVKTYSAPISDIDTDQTLSVMWSVVPTGNAPSYTIPAQPDKSLLLDWSSYSLGAYDINVRVNDGFTNVSGSVLTVNKDNSSPTTGNVTGQQFVTQSDTKDYSIVPTPTDCDSGQTITYMFSIQPQGFPPVYNIPSANGTITVNWGSYSVGVYTIGCRISDGIANVFAGTLNVTVSLAPCVGSAHSYLGTITMPTYSIAAMSVLPRADIAFMESGIGGISGKGLAQIGPSTLGIFEADSTGPSNVVFSYFLGKKDVATSIDSDPIEGRILAVTAANPSTLKVIDSSIIFGNPIVASINTSGPAVTIIAVDADSNGDLYVVTRDTSSGTVYRVTRWNFVPSGSGYYSPVPGSALNITPQVSTNSDIFDIAINWASDRLYLFEAGSNGRGVVHQYNISGGTISFVSSMSNIFASAIDYDASAFGVAGFADIDIDHVDTDAERCRILVYARMSPTSSQLVRLDNTLATLDTKSFSMGLPAFAINPDSSVSFRNLIMPNTGNIEYFSTPGNW